LCATFRMSAFERSVLLLCAGIELDSAFAPLCAAAQGEAGRNFPTFSLALAALPDAHWSALTPAAPLRRCRLIEVGAGPSLAVAPAAAAAVGLRALAIAADLIPAAAAELDALLRLWEREAALGGAVLLVECDGPDPAAGDDDARSRASGTARLIERVGGLVIISAREPRPIAFRPSINIDVHSTTTGEQRDDLREAL